MVAHFICFDKGDYIPKWGLETVIALSVGLKEMLRNKQHKSFTVRNMNSEGENKVVLGGPSSNFLTNENEDLVLDNAHALRYGRS
jgi:hypothetical protein